MRTCTICNKTKQTEDFPTFAEHGKMWTRKQCKDCFNRNKYIAALKSPHAIRNRTLKHKYGITLDDFNRMLSAQNSVCAVCKQPESKKSKTGIIQPLSVDHNHSTGKVRGLLCDNCNTSLGRIKESFETALNLAKYIQHYEGII